jgi:hypothetical protein
VSIGGGGDGQITLVSFDRAGTSKENSIACLMWLCRLFANVLHLTTPQVVARGAADQEAGVRPLALLPEDPFPNGATRMAAMH